ncbi:MAG: DUF2029 domain-containing protein [Actinobacteria bacterium]|nr:DUF2029 domain-containing protein [Actinomycetota bacterium]
MLVLLFASYMSVRPWPDILLHIDFSSYWMAASLLREGAGSSMFDMGRQYAFEIALRHQAAVTDFIRSDTGYNPYPNLPPLALLYVPLTLLPMPWAYAICWIVNFAATSAAVAISLRGYPLGRTVAILMLSFVAVTTSLFEGQPYGLFTLDLAAALLLFRSGRPFWGGVLLGLFWLKPQYAVVFPVIFLLKSRWRELAGMAISGVVVGTMSVLLVGVDGLVAYVRLLEGIGGFRYQWVDPAAMINWRSLLLNLWPAIPSEVGSVLVIGLGAATILASLLVWGGEWDESSPRFQFQVLVTIAATTIASPHSHIHGAIFLLPPLALALAGNRDQGWLPRWWVPILLVGCVLSFAIWPFGAPRWILMPYLSASMVAVIVKYRSASRAPRLRLAQVAQ